MNKQSASSSAERLQKVLATAGLGSRRQIEQWIVDGRIRVNGEIAKLGDRVSIFDRVTVDGRPVQLKYSQAKKTRVLLYHKPIGEICSRHDPKHSATVFDNLPMLRHARWISIGRLDINTAGILLFTNNGELANRLMHPSFQIEREYAVRVFGEISQDMIKNLLAGVELEDGFARFDGIRDAGGDGINHWYHVLLHEGRNHEVKRLWESQNVVVSRLLRVRFGPVQLPRLLKPGRYEELSFSQINELMKLVGLKEE